MHDAGVCCLAVAATAGAAGMRLAGGRDGLTRGAQATGLRLGSPAVDAGALAYLWLDQV